MWMNAWQEATRVVHMSTGLCATLSCPASAPGGSGAWFGSIVASRGSEPKPCGGRDKYEGSLDARHAVEIKSRCLRAVHWMLYLYDYLRAISFWCALGGTKKQRLAASPRLSCVTPDVSKISGLEALPFQVSFVLFWILKTFHHVTQNNPNHMRMLELWGCDELTCKSDCFDYQPFFIDRKHAVIDETTLKQRTWELAAWRFLTHLKWI